MMNSLPALERQVKTLIAQGDFAEAEAMLRPLLASGSGPLTLWRLLVNAIRPQGKITEALAIQEMLVDAAPGDMESRFNLSELLLLQGQFERGWREYRFRYNMGHTSRIERKMQVERWDGRRIAGKTLLIHDEQGFGDTFQFLRMVPWAKEHSGARIILEVNPETVSLAERTTGFDEIIARGTLPPAFDCHCELMSLPMVMGLKLDDLPGPMPYMTPSPKHLAKWRKRLAKLPRPLVAVVWAGRPTHHNDANRSMALDDLAPLTRTGATLLAIQKGPKAEQAKTPPPGMNIVSLSDEIQDFEDTAAILCIADLLISVDSSPVHLAGALGRPTWVMLPFVPDWRWLLDRTDTPWYPGMRLFRQKAPGDWTDVLDRMGTALSENPDTF